MKTKSLYTLLLGTALLAPALAFAQSETAPSGGTTSEATDAKGKEQRGKAMEKAGKELELKGENIQGKQGQKLKKTGEHLKKKGSKLQEKGGKKAAKQVKGSTTEPTSGGETMPMTK
jgi:hypothetical protein